GLRSSWPSSKTRRAASEPKRAGRSCARPRLLQPALCLYAARVGRVLECGVVALVLVGVRLREAGHRPVEDVAGAEVARDRDRVAGARVCLGQGPAADLGVGLEAVDLHRLDESRPLRIPELADVEVPVQTVEADGADPPEHDVARGL